MGLINCPPPSTKVIMWMTLILLSTYRIAVSYTRPVSMLQWVMHIPAHIQRNKNQWLLSKITMNISFFLKTELLQATILASFYPSNILHTCCTVCAPYLVLVVDVGSSIKKLFNNLSVSILSSYSQRRKVSTLQCSKHRDMWDQSMQCRYFQQCSISSAHGAHSREHTGLLTLVTLLGSTPFLSKMSTISVWPLKMATHSGLWPFCTVDKTVLYS